MGRKRFGRALAGLLLGTSLLAMAGGSAQAKPLYNSSILVPNSRIAQVKNLNVKIEGDGDEYLTWTPVKLTENQYLCVEWSSDSSFPNTDETRTASYDSYETNKGRCYLPSRKEGITMYYRACIQDFDAASDNNYTTIYGPYSNVVSYTEEVEKPYFAEKRASKDSVYFRFGRYSDATGTEIWRASASGKYQKIATTTAGVYTDKGLAAGKTYRYKVRNYVWNEKAKSKKVYSDFSYFSMTTFGNDLKLRAAATNSKTVKLTWKRVTGATGYRVYRQEGMNSNSTVSDGMSSSFSTWKLIKTLKGYKKTSYTDKKLTPGQDYSYKVVAYKKNMHVEDIDYVSLDFGSFNARQIENKDGSVTLKWKTMIGAEGYKVERYAKKTNGEWDYVPVTSLSAKTTSYKFTASADTKNQSNEYRIYAYKNSGRKTSGYYYVYPDVVRIEQANGVRAEATADKTGIRVSWTPVKGASYYRVYRSRMMSSYDADRDSYDADGWGDTVYVVENPGKLTKDELGEYYAWSDTPEYTDQIKTTSVVDTYLGYPVREYGDYNPRTGQSEPDRIVMHDYEKGPAQGIVYYYYVRAYGNNGKPVGSGEYEEFYSQRYGKPSSAMLNSVSLSKPSVSKVTAGKKSAAVSWKKVTGAQKYYVYYSTKKNSGYKLGGSTTKTQLKISKLSSRKTYYFKVKAMTYNAAGADVYSALSSAKSVKVK